ncbi:MAG: penicillin-binding protein 2 [bacterium]
MRLWPRRKHGDGRLFPLELDLPSVRSAGEDLAFVDDTMADWGGRVAPDHERNRRVSASVGTARLIPVWAAMLLALVAVMGRAAQIQIADRDHYAVLAEGNRSRIERVPAERGIIFDRTGQTLVTNVPKFSVTVTPADLPTVPIERRIVLGQLAETVGLAPRDIEFSLQRAVGQGLAPTPVAVADDITHEQAVLVEVLSSRWPGVQLLRGAKREYPLGQEVPSLSHVVGFEAVVTPEDIESGDYLPTDRVGRTGLERSYEPELRGEYGRRRVEVDALGRRKTTIAEESGVPGRNLVLTVDADLQRVAEGALRRSLDSSGCRRGSVIVMRPGSGEVLALVSWPAFDNNLFAGGISSQEYAALSEDEDNPLFARAIGAALPSGSVFKPVIAAAALSEGIVTPRTTFMSAGGISVGRWFFPDWKAGGHGLTNLAKAISESVNTYFYIVGGGLDSREGLGLERIVRYARMFGFGERTGIDLAGEGEGFLPSEEWKERTKGEQWFIGDTYHLAIGQGDLLVTPLQVAVMTAAFANGGDIVRPHLVSALLSSDGQREELLVEPVAEDVLPSDVIEAVRQGMRDSVLYGSSRGLSLLPVPAAGKTGTAQWSSQHDNHAWFTSFAPYDRPEISVTVMTEEGVEGSRTAVPVAREIMEYYFRK